MSFATVVVTYNRKELLANNIEMQLKQKLRPDAIFIIDNHGTDNTKEYLQERNLFNDKVVYCYLEENVGGAGGFEEGTRRAYAAGYDYIILMDDDGRPQDEDTFSELITFAESKKRDSKKLMLNSFVVYDSHKLSFTLKGTKSREKALEYQVDGIINDAISPFNGTLLSRELITEMKFPRGDFFIKGDETEYTLRARKYGAFIATITTSLYYHPSLDMQEMKVFGKKMTVGFIETAWKEYYRSRNYTYMYRKNGEKFKAYILYKMRLIVAKKSNSNQQIIDMIRQGYIDGKNEKMGKTVSP